MTLASSRQAHRLTGIAYASLVLRLAEAMRHQPLLAVRYERQAHGAPRQWELAPGGKAN